MCHMWEVKRNNNKKKNYTHSQIIIIIIFGSVYQDVFYCSSLFLLVMFKSKENPIKNWAKSEAHIWARGVTFLDNLDSLPSPRRRRSFTKIIVCRKNFYLHHSFHSLYCSIIFFFFLQKYSWWKLVSIV